MNNRIKNIQSRLDPWSVDALLVENPVDLFYLTQMDLSRGRLLIEQEQVRLFVDGRYYADASKRSPCSVELWKKDLFPFKGRIGFDTAFTTIDGWEQLKKEAKEASWTPLSKPLFALRSMKESYEINLLRKAAELTWAGIQHIKHCLRVGVTEEEIAFEFEMFVRSRGAKGLSFDPIIAFGDHSALPHHRASQKRLEANQIVLIDVGAVVDHYRGDATRVVFFGEPNEELQRMHKIVFEAYFAAKARVRIGQTVGSLDRVVRDFFAKEGVEDLFVHSLGHGIGLETHEPPLLRCDGADRDTLLQAGMVFTIEPGLYLPGFGGIRYENTGVLTENGFESFYSEI